MRKDRQRDEPSLGPCRDALAELSGAAILLDPELAILLATPAAEAGSSLGKLAKKAVL